MKAKNWITISVHKVYRLSSAVWRFYLMDLASLVGLEKCYTSATPPDTAGVYMKGLVTVFFKMKCSLGVNFGL